MLFSLTGFISSFYIHVVSWCSVLPSVLNRPMAQQSKETTLGFNSTPRSPDLAQLPARLPKLGVYHKLLFHQSGQFFGLCSSLIPFTLHLDIFQVHFGNSAQVSVMERTQFMWTKYMTLQRAWYKRLCCKAHKQRCERRRPKAEMGEKREGGDEGWKPCFQRWRGSSQENWYRVAITVNLGDAASTVEM